MESIQVERRDLFGGALSLMMPSTFEDISAYREVPDHQEVMVDKNTERSVIVEILNYEENVADDRAPSYYFSDLATDNEATESIVYMQEINKNSNFIPNIPSIHSKGIIIGHQVVKKFSQGDIGDFVLIYMIIIRLSNVGTDLIITLNEPLSSQITRPNIAPGYLNFDKMMSPGQDKMTIANTSQDILKYLLHSFTINDWSLFA